MKAHRVNQEPGKAGGSRAVDRQAPVKGGALSGSSPTNPTLGGFSTDVAAIDTFNSCSDYRCQQGTGVRPSGRVRTDSVVLGAVDSRGVDRQADQGGYQVSGRGLAERLIPA